MTSTSHGLPHCRKLIMFESPPSMDYCTLCRSYNILNLHLQWPPMDFTHCWSLLHHWSLPPSISTSHGLTQSLHITLYVIISTSHGLPGCKKLLIFESPPPMDSCTLSKRNYIINLHLLWPPTDLDHYWSSLHHPQIYPWISISHGLPQSQHITLYVIISASHGLPHIRKLCVFESPPPIDSHTLSRSFNYWIFTSNDLLWTSTIVDHCYIIHHHLLQSSPPMDFHNLST